MKIGFALLMTREEAHDLKDLVDRVTDWIAIGAVEKYPLPINEAASLKDLHQKLQEIP